MRIVIQRVTKASVSIGGKVKSAIGSGYLILLGIADNDTQEDANWLVKKVIGLRIFDDDDGIMNKSIIEQGGDILCRFTVYATCKLQKRQSPQLASRSQT